MKLQEGGGCTGSSWCSPSFNKMLVLSLTPVGNQRNLRAEGVSVLWATAMVEFFPGTGLDVDNCGARDPFRSECVWGESSWQCSPWQGRQCHRHLGFLASQQSGLPGTPSLCGPLQGHGHYDGPQAAASPVPPDSAQGFSHGRPSCALALAVQHLRTGSSSHLSAQP